MKKNSKHPISLTFQRPLVQRSRNVRKHGILMPLFPQELDVVQRDLVEWYVVLGHLAGHENELGHWYTLTVPILSISENMLLKIY